MKDGLEDAMPTAEEWPTPPRAVLLLVNVRPGERGAELQLSHYHSRLLRNAELHADPFAAGSHLPNNPDTPHHLGQRRCQK